MWSLPCQEKTFSPSIGTSGSKVCASKNPVSDCEQKTPENSKRADTPKNNIFRIKLDYIKIRKYLSKIFAFWRLNKLVVFPGKLNSPWSRNVLLILRRRCTFGPVIPAAF